MQMNRTESDVDKIGGRGARQVLPPKRPLAASYERKSYNDPYGIDAQYHANREQAAEEGFDIPDDPRFRFSDDDTTGVTKSRQGFDRLLKMITQGDAPFTRVYVKDRTRFGRWDDLRQHYYFEVLFKDCGVVLRYSNEPPVEFEGEIDAAGFGEFVRSIFVTFGASDERRKLIKRVRGGLRRRVLDGFYPGPVAPYGTSRWLARQDTKELIEAVTADSARRPGCNFRLLWATDGTKEVVAEIFERFERGESMAAIVRSLNERKVPSPGQVHGAQRWGKRTTGPAPWNTSALSHVLANPIYAGDLYWGTRTDSRDAVPAAKARSEDTIPIYYRDFMPEPPVSRERWATVQRLLADNVEDLSRRRASKPEYALSGLLRCAHCGQNVSGFTHPRGDRYYRHSTPQNPGSLQQRCPHQNRYVRADRIEPAVEEVVSASLTDGALNALAAEELQQRLHGESTQKRMQQLARLRREHSSKEATAVTAATNEAAAKSERQRLIYAATVARISEELESLERRIAALEGETQAVERARQQLEQNHAKHIRLTEEYASADPEVRKRALRVLLERIKVDFAQDEIDLWVRAA
jgi:hypothetical protein